MITINRAWTIIPHPSIALQLFYLSCTHNRYELSSFVEFFDYEKLCILKNFINSGTFDSEKRFVLFWAVNYIKATPVIALKTDLFWRTVNVVEEILHCLASPHKKVLVFAWWHSHLEPQSLRINNHFPAFLFSFLLQLLCWWSIRLLFNLFYLLLHFLIFLLLLFWHAGLHELFILLPPQPGIFFLLDSLPNCWRSSISWPSVSHHRMLLYQMRLIVFSLDACRFGFLQWCPDAYGTALQFDPGNCLYLVHTAHSHHDNRVTICWRNEGGEPGRQGSAVRIKGIHLEVSAELFSQCLIS